MALRPQYQEQRCCVWHMVGFVTQPVPSDSPQGVGLSISSASIGASIAMSTTSLFACGSIHQSTNVVFTWREEDNMLLWAYRHCYVTNSSLGSIQIALNLITSFYACCFYIFHFWKPSALTLGLLAVSQVGSTALLVTVPAVITRGKMAPYMLSALYFSDLQWETFTMKTPIFLR